MLEGRLRTEAWARLQRGDVENRPPARRRRGCCIVASKLVLTDYRRDRRPKRRDALFFGPRGSVRGARARRYFHRHFSAQTRCRLVLRRVARRYLHVGATIRVCATRLRSDRRLQDPNSVRRSYRRYRLRGELRREPKRGSRANRPSGDHRHHHDRAKEHEGQRHDDDRHHHH